MSERSDVSGTPRTDLFAKSHAGAPDEWAISEFKDAIAHARTLERELAAARQREGDLSSELDGVIEDCGNSNGLDEVCLNTIKRVRNTLAKLEQVKP